MRITHYMIILFLAGYPCCILRVNADSFPECILTLTATDNILTILGFKITVLSSLFQIPKTPFHAEPRQLYHDFSSCLNMANS